MKIKKNFSKDPKVRLVSIEEFFEEHNYLCDIRESDLWKDSTIPDIHETYYKFTPKHLICIVFGSILINFGMDDKEHLEEIIVAYRDGKTEYELIDKEIIKLNKKKNNQNIKELDKRIKRLLLSKKLLPNYNSPKNATPKPFSSYLIDTGYITTKEELKDKYVVFDVETNGLRKANDDLLSLSIYDPTTGICYNRFFPLDLQPLVLTSYINGITEKTLVDAVHMTQEELNWLIEYFHLKDRILLSYSGGQGTFDPSFVQNYCERHGLVGFVGLQFQNIKNTIPCAPFGSAGQLSKDNLCKILGIDEVKKVHSSYNDCILEWKLFEKTYSECLFFIQNNLYQYTPEYIIPYSYLSKYPELIEYADITIPHIQGNATEVFKLEFPKELLKEISKFPTNITGITIEHGINRYLKAEEQDNFTFLAQNKSHLKYIGTLDSNIKEIPIIPEDDGTIKAIKEEDKEYVEKINHITKIIINHIKPAVDYLKNNIFKEKEIFTQELVISNDRKVLTLCDLSDSKNVVEIKTFDVLDDEKNIKKNIARQLYYQAKGRNSYILSIKFDTHIFIDEDRIYRNIVDNLNIYIFKVELSEYDPSKVIRVVELNDQEISVFEKIINNPKIFKNELVEKTGLSFRIIDNILKKLELFGYIKKENPLVRLSPWIVLRKTSDKTTKYTIDGNKINILKDYIQEKL